VSLWKKANVNFTFGRWYQLVRSSLLGLEAWKTSRGVGTGRGNFTVWSRRHIWFGYFWPLLEKDQVNKVNLGEPKSKLKTKMATRARKTCNGLTGVKAVLTLKQAFRQLSSATTAYSCSRTRWKRDPNEFVLIFQLDEVTHWKNAAVNPWWTN